jgi:CubicO group peptidase (beta-lactamase class C family)
MSLATVSGGVVTGVAAGGPVTITATSEGVSGTATISVQAANLAAIIETIRTAQGVPAMAAAVVTRAGIQAIGVSGQRRMTGGPAVTLADKWHIGSNLKAITSMLAAIAVQEGVLTWTTTVSQAFPELAGQIRPEFQAVTLRDLLAMRTGIVGNVNPYQGTGALAQRTWATGWALSQPPVSPVGTYYYSNLAYVIAGAMTERALGGVYEDLIVSRIGTPLGAGGIGWGPQALAGASDQPVPHRWQAGGWVACEACDNPPGLSAAGRSHMPIGSWARIVVEFLRAEAGASTLLTQANAQPLFAGITPTGTGTDQYALGWVMTSRPWDGRIATHAGSNLSNESVAWLGLNNGFALLAATNAGGPGGNSSAALNALIVRLLQWYQTGQ